MMKNDDGNDDDVRVEEMLMRAEEDDGRESQVSKHDMSNR